MLQLLLLKELYCICWLRRVPTESLHHVPDWVLGSSCGWVQELLKKEPCHKKTKPEKILWSAYSIESKFLRKKTYGKKLQPKSRPFLRSLINSSNSNSPRGQRLFWWSWSTGWRRQPISLHPLSWRPGTASSPSFLGQVYRSQLGTTAAWGTLHYGHHLAIADTGWGTAYWKYIS